MWLGKERSLDHVAAVRGFGHVVWEDAEGFPGGPIMRMQFGIKSRNLAGQACTTGGSQDTDRNPPSSTTDFSFFS